MKKLLLLGAAAMTVWAAGCGPAVTREATGCETRGAWLNSSAFNTAASRAATLDTVERANLNTVFAIAPPISDNRGWSTPEAFKALVEDANARGLSVHAWVCNLWRSLPGRDFRDPAEREAQAQWAADLLAAYPGLDGVHLDYIRYPDREPLSEEKMDAVSATVDKVHAAIETAYPGKHLTAAVRSLSQYCADWDAEYVPPWYRDWFAAHPGNRWDDSYWCAADDMGVPQPFTNQQDPAWWLMNDYVDDVVSMEYTMYAPYWKGEVDIWKSWLPDRYDRVYMGLGWYTEDHFANPGHVVEKIRYGRSRGVNGFAVFELGRYDDEPLVDALAVDGPVNGYDAPFGEPTASCLAAAPVPTPSPEPTCAPAAEPGRWRIEFGGVITASIREIE
jgi:hypothetical protein